MFFVTLIGKFRNILPQYVLRYRTVPIHSLFYLICVECRVQERFLKAGGAVWRLAGWQAGGQIWDGGERREREKVVAPFLLPSLSYTTLYCSVVLCFLPLLYSENRSCFAMPAEFLSRAGLGLGRADMNLFQMEWNGRKRGCYEIKHSFCTVTN